MRCLSADGIPSPGSPHLVGLPHVPFGFSWVPRHERSASLPLSVGLPRLLSSICAALLKLQLPDEQQTPHSHNILLDNELNSLFVHIYPTVLSSARAHPDGCSRLVNLENHKPPLCMSIFFNRLRCLISHAQRRSSLAVGLELRLRVGRWV